MCEFARDASGPRRRDVGVMGDEASYILSPTGGEGRVRGMVANDCYWQCKTQ